MNIVLVGMRGAGKSNISRRLSVLTKWPVLSTDLLISYENQGKTIATIIDEENGDWRSFREMEYEVIKKISLLDNVIIDCGGGVIVDLDDNGEEIFSTRKIDLLKQNGTVIWLKGDIQRLAEKIKNDEERPTLDQLKSTVELMHRRLPFYQQAADKIVDIEKEKRKRLAEKIYRLAFK